MQLIAETQGRARTVGFAFRCLVCESRRIKVTLAEVLAGHQAGWGSTRGGYCAQLQHEFAEKLWGQHEKVDDNRPPDDVPTTRPRRWWRR